MESDIRAELAVNVRYDSNAGVAGFLLFAGINPFHVMLHVQDLVEKYALLDRIQLLIHVSHKQIA